MPATNTGPLPSTTATSVALPAPGDEQHGLIELADGRRLAYVLLGAPAGPAVVVLDGPGSRGLVRAASNVATAAGIRLIAPDRPGFGASTPAPARTIADWPRDHLALLDALGIQRAGVLCQSGGTPFALAVAAALPERTVAIAALGALAPLDDPAALAAAGKPLRIAAKLAPRAPWLVRAGLRAAARSARRHPAKTAARVAKNLPAADAEIMRDPAWWRLHEQAVAEILGQPDGFSHEGRLITQAWGINLDAVTVPVAFWTGAEDHTHPPAHARLLAARLQGAPVHIVPHAATFGLVPHYDEALRFATNQAR